MIDLARLQVLFEQACKLTPAQQAAFVNDVSDDPQVRVQLADLLRADESVREITARKAFADLPALMLKGHPESLLGTQVGHYTLVSSLGVGGMGSVFMAERNDGVVQQTVAIKFLGRDLLAEGFRQRFEIEREILARLDHPNITRLVDAGQLADGTPYLVMDYVEGVPVTHYAMAKRLGVKARLKLFCDVAEAVAYAHRALIVHRDIKPGNILVDAAGVVHLLDFGIAKPLATLGEHAVSATATGQRFFSPQHAAPEQLLGENITVSCDVYGLGCLLYELLAAVPAIALNGLSAAEAEAQILHELPKAPSARLLTHPQATETIRSFQVPNLQIWAKTLRGDLDSMVLTCLRKEPAARYHTVDELIADVRAYLANKPIAARSSHRWYRTKKFVTRHRWAVSTAALVGVALIAASVLVAAESREAMRQRDNAQSALIQAELQRDRAGRVTDFLIDAFAAANPGGDVGRSVTAKDILDQGSRKLETELADQPELKAQLLATIAEAQLALTMPDDAELSALKAVALLPSQARPELSLTVIGSLSKVHSHLRHWEQAMALLQPLHELELSREMQAQLVALEVRALRAGSRQQENLALIRGYLSELSDADPLLVFPAVMDVRLDYSDLLRLTGDSPAALREIQKIEDSVGIQSLPAEQRIHALKSKAHSLASMKRYPEARVVAEDLMLLSRSVYGERSRASAVAATVFAGIVQDGGDPAAALPLFENVLTAYEEIYGKDGFQVALALNNVALAAAALPNQDALAEHCFRRSIAVVLRHHQRDSKTLFTFRAYFAEFLIERGRDQEVAAVLTEAMSDFAASAEYAVSASVPKVLAMLNRLDSHAELPNH